MTQIARLLAYAGLAAALTLAVVVTARAADGAGTSAVPGMLFTHVVALR